VLKQDLPAAPADRRRAAMTPKPVTVGQVLAVVDRCPAPGARPRPKIELSELAGRPFVEGQRYVFMLKPKGIGRVWINRKFPAPHYKCPATPHAVAEMQIAADPARWPWAPAVDGLQVAAIIRDVSPKNLRTDPTLAVFVAVRNASKAPIHVNQYGPDRTLRLEAVSAGGRRVVHDFHRDRPQRGPAPSPKPQDVVTLQPGEWLALSPYGAAGRGGEGPICSATYVRMPLPKGIWRFRATYVAETPRLLGKPLWRGRAASKPYPVRIGPGPELPADPTTRPTATAPVTPPVAPASVPAREADRPKA
jgi:hypothetical protein